MKTIRFPSPRWLTSAKVSFLDGLAKLKVLWNIWDLRVFILVSLGLQTLLILIAPFRKQTANIWVILSVWLAYLLADYVAYQAIGLIPKYNARSNTTSTSNGTHEDLLAFWSPFLLVHLGGPDTITALALEDNELWKRTALHLVTQVSATGRVFFQSLPMNLLWLPTILMFIAGILKYIERTSSLFFARLTKFKSSMLTEPDPGPNYAKLMETYDSYRNSHLRAEFQTNPEPQQNKFAQIEIDDMSSGGEEEQENAAAAANNNNNNKKKEEEEEKNKNIQLVRDAFELFNKFKGLYVDLIFSFHDRNTSRAKFLKLNSEKAFTIIEIELNFTYEVFFTKMVVIRQMFGTIIRWISVICEAVSLLIWILFIEKHEYKGTDIRITYTLLGGAIVLDAFALLRVLLSDWSIATLNKESELRASFYDKILSFRNRPWGKYWGSKGTPFWPCFRRAFFRRWSESISQFNLLYYCVDEWSACSLFIFKCIPIKDKFDSFFFVSKKWFPDELRDFIFKELKYKSEIADEPKDAEEVCDSTGDWVLRSLMGDGFDMSELYPWTADVEYDECVLLWHIATELLYQADEQGKPTQPNVEEQKKEDNVGKREQREEEEEEEGSKEPDQEKKYREYCKTLSDYMMYLLTQQPGLMLAVAGISEVRFRDTCAEATKFYHRVLPKATTKESKEVQHQNACKRIMEVTTKHIKPKDIKGDRSKSVLFDGCRLARKLQEVQRAKKKNISRVGMWELMAKVWVELVCYSASHCRADAHAAQLKQGGELLTLVWLLMVHLGLGKQFRITQGNARSKLIINK